MRHAGESHSPRRTTNVDPRETGRWRRNVFVITAIKPQIVLGAVKKERVAIDHGRLVIIITAALDGRRCAGRP
jgi:hypothetical protein